MPHVPTVSLDELPQLSEPTQPPLPSRPPERPEQAGAPQGGPTGSGDGAVLLDVREHDEWAAGHAPQALHLPMGELVERLDELPADGTLYVICRSGGRSARVAAYLNANGWDAVNVVEGMLGWQASGRPLVARDGAEPRVL